MNNDMIKVKELINLKKYKELNEYLEKMIIEYVVELIKEREEDFEYTTIFDLIDVSKEYIKDERKNIAKQIRVYSNYLDEIDNVYRLLELCKNYNIKII